MTGQDFRLFGYIFEFQDIKCHNFYPFKLSFPGAVRITVPETNRTPPQVGNAPLDIGYRDQYNSHVYRILFTDTAKRQYEKLDGKLRRQVDKAIDRISKCPSAGKPLTGDLKGIWSERVSTFRVLYRVIESRIEILILVIEHRRKVYGGH